MAKPEYIDSHSTAFKNPKQYIKAKVKILSDPRGFGITPTEEEMAHLHTLKTQIAIDNAIISIRNRRWDK